MDVCKIVAAARIPMICSQSRSFLNGTPIQIRSRGSALKLFEKKSLKVHARGLDGHSNELYSGGSGGLYTPLQVKTSAGKYLSKIVRDSRNDLFYAAVEDQLRRLSDDRHKVSHLMNASNVLMAQRMIQETKTKTEVEEIMYMLICRRFFEIGVHILPRISDCMVQGRLELSSSRSGHDQLRCIQSPELLELVERYIARISMLDGDSGVNNYRKLIHIDPEYLPYVYDFGLTNGHFFRSVSFRYALEKNLAKNIDSNQDEGIKEQGTNVVPISTLNSYAYRFPQRLKTRLSTPKSQEAMGMMSNHLEALFSQIKPRLSATSGLITTSPGTLWRIVLEGLAFGTFLWDTEYLVSKFYKLDDYEDLLHIP